MKDTIHLTFRPLFIAMGNAGLVSRPCQADLQVRFCPEWVLR